MKLKLADIARIVGGDIVSPPGAGAIDIVGVAKIERAGPGEITFVGAPRYEKYLATTRAAAVIVTPDVARARRSEGSDTGPTSALIQVEDPYRAFVKLMGEFVDPDEPVAPGVHSTAVVPASASVHPDARLGPYVVLGDRVTVGAGTCLWPHVVVGTDCRIGAECRIHANVSIGDRCHLGDRVIVHAGAALGADGFGFLPSAGGRREKVPHLGGVRIEDDVEIGANSTIDRATVDQTVIRRGSKLDNLVQIAHNVEIGEDTCIAAQAAIGGSTSVGARNLIAGHVAIADHIATGDDVILMGKTGVATSIDEPGIYCGAPAMERGSFFRVEAAIRRLPETLRRLKELERRLAALEKAEVGES